MEYKSIKEIALLLSCSEKTVRRIIHEMQRSGDFPPETFMVRLKRVDWQAVKEYCGRTNDLRGVFED